MQAREGLGLQHRSFVGDRDFKSVTQHNASFVHSGERSVRVMWSLALQSAGRSGASLSDLQQMAGVQVISPRSVDLQVSPEMSLPQESLLQAPY